MERSEGSALSSAETPSTCYPNANYGERFPKQSCIENDTCSKTNAVSILNFCKRYRNSPPILENVSMNVKKGEIYGLLGPSGCGKTTVISCIVGLKKWDTGSLLVFGKEPELTDNNILRRKVGFMPQDTGLFKHLSIKETLTFFGMVYNMTSTEITVRRVFLSKMLGLPDNGRLVGNLSGGQQRRTSLALALLHSPDLLVLDEPTVGIDPVQRESIWNYLNDIVKLSGTTVLITTHYIEEARFCNTVGIMRMGRLLVEDNPANLIRSHKCTSLEKVFLKLCRHDENYLARTSLIFNDKSNQIFKSPRNESMSSDTVNSNKKNQNLSAVFNGPINQDIKSSDNTLRRAQTESHYKENTAKPASKVPGIWKNASKMFVLSYVLITRYIRSPMYLFALLSMPCIQESVTLWAMGSVPSGLTVGVVNHEFNNWLGECGLSQKNRSSCTEFLSSCAYINILNGSDVINLQQYDTEDDALSELIAAEFGDTCYFQQISHSICLNS